MKVLETNKYWQIRCRACGHHYIPKERLPNKTWNFNGDCQNPTFTPSVNESCNPVDHKDHNVELPSSRCHFVVSDGKISYCGDCTHELANQTLDLEAFPDVEVLMHQFDHPMHEISPQ